MIKKILVSLLIVILAIFVITKKEPEGNLVKPQMLTSSLGDQPTTKTPSPEPTLNAPKTFQFDSSTDLKAELEKINPQVLDSDFE